MKKLLFHMAVVGHCLLFSAPIWAQRGMGFVVEGIEVRGNHKTKQEVILRSITLTEGERLTPENLAASRDALYRTRLFRTAHIASKPGSEQGKAVVVVYVEEKRFGDIGLSLEYTELDGYGFASDAYHVNLWGEGKVVGVEYGLGERFKYWGVQYIDPWSLGSTQSVHVNVSGTSSDRDLFRSKNSTLRGRYDLERIGGSIGIGRLIGTDYRIVLKYELDAIQIGDFQRPITPTAGGIFADEINASLGRESVAFFSLDFHRRPSWKPWGSAPGVDFRLQLDGSAVFLGSTADFVRLRTELYKHLETTPGQILSLGGKAGAIGGNPPFYERFYLDGPNQLRGFDRRTIGPEGGTEFIAAEILYSISLKRLGRFYGFLEGAGVRRTVAGSARKDADATFGIGFLLFNRIDFSFGIGTETLTVRSHKFGGINVGL